MWDLPGPRLEPVSPPLAGGFLTTVPPEKPLKYRFYCTGVVRPTDQQTTAIGKTVCYIHRSQEKGAGCATREGWACGQHHGQSGGRGGKLWERAFIVLSVGRNGQRKVSRLKAGEMDDFSSLWSIRAVPSRVWYLTPV